MCPDTFSVHCLNSKFVHPVWHSQIVSTLQSVLSHSQQRNVLLVCILQSKMSPNAKIHKEDIAVNFRSVMAHFPQFFPLIKNQVHMRLFVSLFTMLLLIT